MEPSLSDRRPRPRIETLADLIFGLSLSIGAIGLIADAPVSSGEINSHILAFGFTFLVLITAWIIYTTYMSVLPAETKSVMFLNVALLLLVALVPYLLNSVELVNPALTPADSSALRDYSSTLFTVDLAGIMVILAAFAHVISLEEKKLVARDLAELFRNGRNRLVVLAVLVAVSIAPQFLGMDPPRRTSRTVRVVRPPGIVLGREGAPASEPDIPAIVTEYFRRGSSSAAASPKGPAAIRVHLSISKQALVFPVGEDFEDHYDDAGRWMALHGVDSAKRKRELGSPSVRQPRRKARSRREARRNPAFRDLVACEGVSI